MASICGNRLKYLRNPFTMLEITEEFVKRLIYVGNNNNNKNDLISVALFHVKHAQLRCTMPMNNTYTHARVRACIKNI